MPRKRTSNQIWVDTHIRLPEDLHDRITSMAVGEFRSFNQQVIACLERCAAPASRTTDPTGEPYRADPTTPTT